MSVTKSQELNLSDPVDASIPYKLEITLSSNQRNLLYGLKGNKVDLNPLKLLFNDVRLKPKTLRTRGNSTLKYKRKSLLLHFPEPMPFEGAEVKKLAVNNLVLDRNYWRNRVSFLMMEKLGLFPLKNQFTEVRINGQSEGTYLSVQKPDDYAESINSPLLLRRVASGQIEIDYNNGADEKAEIKRLKAVKKVTKTLNGEALYDELNKLIVLDRYFQWLGFNYLVMNGDYTDELFFYLIPGESRYDVLPWDYDDVFVPQPHEGTEERNEKMTGRLIYSSEAYFDLVVDQHDYLYFRYLEEFAKVLDTLTPEFIQSTFEQVYTELFPFFKDPQIINQSAFDGYGVTNLEAFKNDLNKHFEFVINRRSSLISEVQKGIDQQKQ